jgi:hypothetical protein
MSLSLTLFNLFGFRFTFFAFVSLFGPYGSLIFAFVSFILQDESLFNRLCPANKNGKREFLPVSSAR